MDLKRNIVRLKMLYGGIEKNYYINWKYDIHSFTSTRLNNLFLLFEDRKFNFSIYTTVSKFETDKEFLFIDISLIMGSFFSDEYGSIRIDKESITNCFFLNNKLRINIFRHNI